MRKYGVKPSRPRPHGTTASFHRKKSLPKMLVLGLTLGLFLTAGLLLLFAALLAAFDYPHGMIGPLSLAAVGGGVFLTAFFAGRQLHTGGIKIGLLTGMGYSLLLMGCALLAGRDFLGSISAARPLYCLAVSIPAGILGVNCRIRGEFKP